MMFKQGMLPPMRKPMDTIDELDSLHTRTGKELDALCDAYDVQRLDGESDDSLRARGEDVIRIRRYSRIPAPAMDQRDTEKVPPQLTHKLETLQAFRDDVLIALKLRRWDLVERAIAFISEIE